MCTMSVQEEHTSPISITLGSGGFRISCREYHGFILTAKKEEYRPFSCFYGKDYKYRSEVIRDLIHHAGFDSEDKDVLVSESASAKIDDICRAGRILF